MIYKDKILLLHRNSIVQERISGYLRDNGFGVIMASSVDNTINLVRSMKPDVILWGETLTAHSKEVLKKICESRMGSTIPVIALVSDIELFDRIEVEKIGINDVLDSSPSLPDLKVKIRFQLGVRNKLKQYEKDVRRLQNISGLQYNIINVQNVNRLCELVNDYIFDAYSPSSLITLAFNPRADELTYSGLLTSDAAKSLSKDSIFDLPLWKDYFFTKNQLEAGYIADKYILDFFRQIGLESDVYYQLPLNVKSYKTGLIILGISGQPQLPKNEYEELLTLTNSLASRLKVIHQGASGRLPVRDDTTEIKNLFQRLNEDEVSSYLSRQLMTTLQADICIYCNYNPGFNFLYPQYCYKTGSKDNIFENEKPPVLLVKEYPAFMKYMSSNQASAYFNLHETPAEDLTKMAGIAGGTYNSILLFKAAIGNEIKGFYIIGNEDSRKRVTNNEIQSAEQMIHKAANIVMESRLIRSAQKTIKQLDRVFELGKELTLESEIDDLLRKIANSIRRTLGWNIVILERKNPYNNSYENVTALGMKGTEYSSFRKKYSNVLYDDFRDNCFKISNSYFCDHAFHDEQLDNLDHRRFLMSLGKEWDDNDWLLIPILSRGNELGFLAVNDPVERIRPTEDKVRSLEYFANQAAVALENAALYENLKESEEKYRLLAETMTMGLVTCDFNGKIIYTNRSLAQMLQYKDGSVLLNYNLYDLCSSQTRSELEKHILKFVKNRKPKEREGSEIIEGVEIDLMSNSNEYIPLSLYTTPYSQHGQQIGFIGVLSDLRPYRRIERLKTDFNSMIVHDLRSPLNIIQGYIDIVRTEVVGKISEEQGELLFIAKENVDKVLKLIENFLIASKIEAGKFDLNIEIHSINALIEAVYEGHLVLAQNKDIEMKMTLDNNISLQQFDKMRIEQVLSNFISNALKFTSAGGDITITSKLVKETNELTKEETMAAHVSVEDTGVGIPLDEQKKVFSKYEQTEAGKDASLKGTGLGLAICKEIISLHKGRVWVKSVPSSGSTFYFSLPIEQIKI